MRSRRLAQGAVEDRRRHDLSVVRPAIHHHLAEDRPDAVGLGRPERDVHRGFEHDAVGQDRGRAGGREGLEDRRGEPLGDGGVGPRPLGREGQPVEPRQQVEGEPEARIGHLWQVGMEVDHPRRDHPRTKVERGVGLGRPAGGRARVGKAARIVDHDQSVGLVPRAADRQRRHQPRAQRKRRPIGKQGDVHAGEASTPQPQPMRGSGRAIGAAGSGTKPDQGECSRRRPTGQRSERTQGA